MSHNQDSFNDEELTQLAEEITKDLVTQPDLHPNHSFTVAFKLKIDVVTSKSNNQNESIKHNPLPSWSYLSISNTEAESRDILTPSSLNSVTPYTPPYLLTTDSFPEIPSVTPQASLKVSKNNGYNWVNKSYPQKLSFNTPSLQLTSTTNMSSIASEDTIISATNQKLILSIIPGLNESTKSPKNEPIKTITSPVLINTFDQFKNDSKNEYAMANASMEVNDDFNIEYGVEYDDGLIFVNPEHMWNQ